MHCCALSELLRLCDTTKAPTDPGRDNKEPFSGIEETTEHYN